MATIINTSIDLTKIPKDKIVEGKKGKYLPVTIKLNDEFDKFGNNGPITVGQSKEERENKEPLVYLGNVKVIWTNGVAPQVAPRDGQPAQAAPAQNLTQVEDNDLPF